MSYLIIAVVVLLALAPLSHFVPSRRQRREASLREAAAVAGLFVEFRDLPLSGGARESGPSRRPRANAIYYGLRLRPSRGRERRRGSWLREGDDWRPAGDRQVPPEPLRELPGTVLAASVDEGSCGVYWREDGDLETVAGIHRALAAWADQLQSG